MTLAYGNEYRRGTLFWGTRPGTLVLQFSSLLRGEKRILDAGCGEGKNAVYLAAALGADVVAVDSSRVALQNFELQPEYRPVTRRISRIQADIAQFQFPGQIFDAVVAYGILHCFIDWRASMRLVQSMKAWTIPGGIHLIAACTDAQPLDSKAHPYLHTEGLVPASELLKSYRDCEILHFAEDVLTEVHPTTMRKHTHGMVRAVIRMPT